MRKRFLCLIGFTLVLQSSVALAGWENMYDSVRLWCARQFAGYMPTYQTRLSVCSANSYTADDFPASAFWRGTRVVGKREVPFSYADNYAKWAAERANDVATRFLQRQELLEVIVDDVADKRGTLHVNAILPEPKDPENEGAGYMAYEQVVHGQRGFGIVRDDYLMFVVDSTRERPLSEAFRKLRERAIREVKRPGYHDSTALQPHFKRWYPWAVPVLGKDMLLRHTYYTTLSGEKIQANAIVQFTGGVLKGRVEIIHPHPSSGKKIFKDALVRLERLQPTTYQDEKMARKFLNGVYGFYTPNYWWRGSGGTGRPILAGIYHAVFGRKIPDLGDGVDTQAMTALTQEEFVEEMLPKLLQ